jgi:FkbM family methyltransferase
VTALVAGRPVRYSESDDGAVRIASYADDVSPAPFTCRCEACEREGSIVAQIVRAGDRVVDAGANVGHYAMVFSRLAGPAGAVLAFEPDPDNFALLVHNVACNGAANVEAVELALLDAPGRLKLHRSTTNYARHSFRDANVPNAGPPIDVPVARLDDVARERGYRVDVLKVDVEGSELKTLAGARRILEEEARVVWFEYWPQGAEGDLAACDEVMQTFFRSGYEMVWIDLFTGVHQRIADAAAARRGTEALLDRGPAADSLYGLKLVEVLATRDR